MRAAFFAGLICTSFVPVRGDPVKANVVRLDDRARHKKFQRDVGDRRALGDSRGDVKGDQPASSRVPRLSRSSREEILARAVGIATVGVFVKRRILEWRQRRRVRLTDGDRHSRWTRCQRAVAGPISKPVRPGKVGIRCIGERAIRIERQCTARRIGHDGGHQAVVLWIGIIRQHAGRRINRQRLVCAGRVGIVQGGRRDVGRVNRDRDGGDIRCQQAVTGPISERVRANKARARCIGERTIGVEG